MTAPLPPHLVDMLHEQLVTRRARHLQWYAEAEAAGDITGCTFHYAAERTLADLLGLLESAMGNSK